MNKQFVYITGSSGSGSNIVARILSRIDNVLGVGETHLNTDSFLAEKANQANQIAWDRRLEFKQHDHNVSRFLEALGALEALEENDGITHLVFKRNVVKGDQYRPDLVDLRASIPEAKTVVMYRRPEAAAFSSFRRKLGDSLRHCAIIQTEELTLLARTVSQIPPESCMVLSYEKFCRDPKAFSGALADFCGLPKEAVDAAAGKEPIDLSKLDRWQEALGAEQAERLTDFFSKRVAHWHEIPKREAMLAQ